MGAPDSGPGARRSMKRPGCDSMGIGSVDGAVHQNWPDCAPQAVALEGPLPLSGLSRPPRRAHWRPSWNVAMPSRRPKGQARTARQQGRRAHSSRTHASDLASTAMAPSGSGSLWRRRYAGAAALLAAACLCYLLFGRADRSFAPESRTELAPGQLKAIAGATDMATLWDVDLRAILVPRPVGSEALAGVRKHIVETLQGLGWEVELDTFTADTPIGRRTFSNIIATLDPSASSRLVMSAHYESKYFTGKDAGFVGAVDSAVPCALLLDVARGLAPQLGARRQSLGTTLQLIFFDGEEAFQEWTDTDSIYGARHLADKFARTRLRGRKTELEAIELLILLDLLGAPDPNIYSSFDNTKHVHEKMEGLERRLTDTGVFRHKGFNHFAPSNRRGHFIQDDHLPFLQRNVPVLHVIPVPFPKVWHTIKDDEAHLSRDAVYNWSILIRAFVCEYLHLPL